MNIIEGAVEAISNIIIGEKGTKGEWEKENRFKSFASERENCHVKWYVDGKDYFYAVSEALMTAREEIFIEDWWLSPELYLRRPPTNNEEYRLDRLLKKKAEQGVKIYVVVYKEMSQALTLDSKHSKEVLESLHKNVVEIFNMDLFLKNNDDDDTTLRLCLFDILASRENGSCRQTHCFHWWFRFVLWSL